MLILLQFSLSWLNPAWYCMSRHFAEKAPSMLEYCVPDLFAEDIFDCSGEQLLRVWSIPSRFMQAFLTS